MNKKNLIKIFQILEKETPKPVTELIYKTNFQLLIAVILSAQATDKSVNAATKKLFKIAPDAKSIYKLGENKLKEYIKTIGLYNAKAKNVIATCKALLDKYDNKIPRTREILQSLPGVGRKTANVVLNNAFGQPTIGVDTHVFRVSNRLGIAPGKNVLQVEKKLEENIPDNFKMHAHHWLIILGRYTCMARRPNCFNCNVTKYCDYEKKSLANS